MEKINIAELLKDCPKGMKLYSPIFGEVYLDKIRPHLAIVVTTDKEQGNFKEEFLYDGRYGINGECMLFPSKGKTTLEGFQRPFKDGDVISNGEFIAIFCKFDNGHMYYHCWYNPKNLLIFKAKIDFGIGYIHEYNYATKEEKQKLFKAIKDNGYKWNPSTKNLEKLVEPKFKVGEYIVNDYCMGKVIALTDDAYLLDTEQCIPFSCEHNVRHWTIQDVKNGDVLYHSDSASNGIFIFKELLEYEFEKKVICYCDYDSEDGFCLGESHTCCWADAKILHPATKEQCNLLFKKIKEAGYKWNPETKILAKLINPKFKVGDRIRHKASSKISKIIDIRDDSYITGNVNGNVTVGSIPFSVAESDYELITKFDISTLIPFESRVLVRDDNNECWIPAIWALKKVNKDDIYSFVVVGGNDFVCCVPYYDNQHLLGTTDDCDEYYKTWE